jgi:cbb3-type cytochrome oxidase maturation protein
MNALYLQILIGVGVMVVIVIGFIISVKSGQYDDLDSPAYRILMDDDDPRIPSNNQSKDKKNTDSAK